MAGDTYLCVRFRKTVSQGAGPQVRSSPGEGNVPKLIT